MGEKFDAFGRKVGEDTLADAGWRVPDRARGEDGWEQRTIEASDPVSVTPPPSSLPRPEPSTAAPTPFDEARAARLPRRRRGGGRFVVILAVLIFGGVFVSGLVSGIVEEIDEASDGSGGFSFEIGNDQTQGGAPPADAPQPPGQNGAAAEGASLYQPAQFRAALAALDKEGGSPMMIRLAPTRLNTQLIDGGELKIVEVGADLKLRQVASAPAPAGTTTILLKSIDPGAPQRLLRDAERTHKLPASKAAYLVAMDFNGSIVWNAFYESGAHVQGDKSGKLSRRVS